MNPVENETLCSTASACIRHGVGRLSNFPGLLRKIIENEAWKSRQTRTGKVVECESLAELITAKPPRGWAEDLSKVEAVIKDEPDVLRLYRNAMKLKGGRYSDNNVIGIEDGKAAKQGNSRAYKLDRLERDAPEFYQKVIDGELSAHRACIEAGIIKEKSALEKAQAAVRKLDEGDYRDFMLWVLDPD